jgi:glycosyltransferase involved in cell wall biosynthesis
MSDSLASHDGHHGRALRILHVVTSLEPGGMENGVCNLAQGLLPRGIAAHVACLERSGPFAQRLPDPAQVTVLGKGNGFSVRAVFALWRAIRRLSPDVVHTHNLGPLIYASLATLGGRTRPILHGEHSQLAAWELQPTRLRQRRRGYRACRKIHTVSQPQLAELLGLGFPPEKLCAIPNGVDTTRFVPAGRTASRERLGLPGDAQVIGLVGRFGPYKGHRVLLEAFQQIAPRFPASRLVFLGAGGSEEAAIRALVSAHPASDRIHLAGFQPDPAACYPALNLLAVPSSNEGLSNAALEAMACGVPVLANAGPGREGIVTPGHDGWLGNFTAAAPLAAVLALALSEPQALVDMGCNARLTVATHFSLGTMLDAYAQLYRHLAA